MKRVDKAHKEEIMKRIEEAGNPDNYETSWSDEGIPKSKKKSNIKRGGSARARGARFELKVRQDLESKGRIVDKWSNNVDLEKDRLVIAKKKFNPYSKVMTISTGFPDFISIKEIHDGMYSVIGIEVKMNGTLSKEEKEKCAWYLQKRIFSDIWIAKKGEKRGEIKYDDFKEKYGEKYNKT